MPNCATGVSLTRRDRPKMPSHWLTGPKGNANSAAPTEQQRHDEAIAALDRAAQLEPAEPATYDLLTSAYNAAGQTEAAAAAAQQALALYEQAAIDQPQDPVTAHLELGYAHLRAEQYPRALDEFTARGAGAG